MQNKSPLHDAIRNVTFHGGFWGGLVERNRAATLPHVMHKCVDEGHVLNLDIAAGKSDAPYRGGADLDSNLHKVIEGAALVLASNPDKVLDATIDQWITKLAAVQEPDGYLQSYISSQTPDERYKDLHRSHELYCMGHMIEAAVEHFYATGKRAFLDVAVRAADHMDATFGYGKSEKTSGHQEVELAIVKLFEATGQKKYLDLSRYFVDIRGDRGLVHRDYSGKPIIDGDRTPGRNRPPEYRQDHKPAVEQRQAVGHAVRAGYFYAAMTDLAMHCDSQPHAQAVAAIWDDIVNRKLYITGGVGTHQYRDEGFGDPYLLPNDSAYCETCGGIALLLFSHRMGLLTGEARYADLIEIILNNNMLACTDLAGVNFFYRNPLASDGSRKRNDWCHPACCPTNIIRIVPQLARLAYAQRGDSIFVDQFVNSTASVKLDAGTVRITQQSNYPWDGKITLTLDTDSPMEFSLHIRIPSWTRGRPVTSDLYVTHHDERDQPTVTVNGRAVDPVPLEKGYCVIRRVWQKGDRVVVDLPMPVKRVRAHENVESCRGQIALMRGPMVYCFEEADNPEPAGVVLTPDTTLNAVHRADLLGGVTVIRDAAQSTTAIPYFAWNNRRQGKMTVWVPDNL
ncbi:MAG: glycoside hydrolase family 127 protein [Phycisphaera sp.]|nr:glycoside hydrolase family 127 protein [Phycisphaera sp.]